MSKFHGYGPTWLIRHTLFKEDPGRGGGRLPGSLIAAVSGIVAIASDKSRRTGDLGALRDAIEAALGPANEDGDPRETNQTDLPRIADADPMLEAARLGALAARG